MSSDDDDTYAAALVKLIDGQIMYLLKSEGKASKKEALEEMLVMMKEEDRKSKGESSPAVKDGGVVE